MATGGWFCDWSFRAPRAPHVPQGVGVTLATASTGSAEAEASIGLYHLDHLPQLCGSSCIENAKYFFLIYFLSTKKRAAHNRTVREQDSLTIVGPREQDKMTLCAVNDIKL